MLTIDKNIPIPTERTHSTAKKYPFGDMEVGDSFLVPGKKKVSQMGSTIPNARARYGFEFTSKLEEGGLRIWRIS